MKRQDFLRKMRSRRRHDRLDLREPEQRRAVDWRTLRFELPASGTREQASALGTFRLKPDGVRLEATAPCWVRGYRLWRAEDGTTRVEFQIRPVQGDQVAPPGVETVAAGGCWESGASS